MGMVKAASRLVIRVVRRFVDRDGELVVAGVASFVTGDPWVPGTQGWDVRVDAFEDWIDNIIGEAEPILPFGPDLHPSSPGPGSTVVSVDGENAWEMGAIQTPSDEDSFEFTLDATTDVTVTAAGIDGRLNTVLQLYDSDLTSLGFNNDLASGNTNSQISQTLDPGTYYLTVSPLVDGSVGWYSVAIDLGPNPSGDQHIGNLHPLATDLTPNDEGQIALRETLESNGDRDVFEFVVDQTSTVQFAATSASSNLNPRLLLYSSGGAKIHDNDDVRSPNETDSYFFVETLDPGSYYLMVGLVEFLIVR